MKILKLLYLSFTVVLMSSHAYSAVRCENLFLSQKQFDEKFEPEILSTKQSQKFLDSTVPDKESGSTTGDRTEYKYTLVTSVTSQKLRAFKKAIESEIPGFELANRDPLTPGYRNVTLTNYSNRFKLKLASGEKVTMKIRFRKYGLISKRKNVTTDNFKPIKGMEDVSFLEFKIGNPEYEYSVLKPRIKILDSDALALENPDLTPHEYFQIAQRCVELNKAKTEDQQEIVNETITLMLRAMRGLHKKGSVFNLEYQTLYERASFKVPINDSVTKESYEVQITIDENISAKSISFDFEASSYGNQKDKIAVTEVKIPIALIEKLTGEKIRHKKGERRKVTPEQLRELLSQADYEKYPGLKPVMDFLQTLQFNTLRSYEENHGKLFHLRQEIKEDLEP